MEQPGVISLAHDLGVGGRMDESFQQGEAVRGRQVPVVVLPQCRQRITGIGAQHRRGVVLQKVADQLCPRHPQKRPA